MKQAFTYLPTYAADNSAMCSALYELGGMLVMHDASGCNSTYTTHDEPRWFDRPANVFITALTETDAILGNEGRLIDDVAQAAAALSPAFIALAGTPIPMMMGCDYDGLAREIEAKTGVPGIGVDTNGTDDYVAGAGKAFRRFAERFVEPLDPAAPPARIPESVNILGVTPLDFSVNGTAEAIDAWAMEQGFTLISNWAMGPFATIERMRRAARASVNWVVSGAGVPTALFLEERFGTPFVVGAPFGRFMCSILPEKLREAARTGRSVNLAAGCRGNFTPSSGSVGGGGMNGAAEPPETLVIGEAVAAAAIRASLVRDFGMRCAAVMTPLTAQAFLLGAGDGRGLVEEDFRRLLPACRMIVADPFYGHFARRLAPESPPECVDLPHEALSGRIWRDAMPVLVGEGFNDWFASRASRAPLV